MSLGDLVLRRTTLAIGGQVSARYIGRIAEIAAAELGWDEGRREREITEFITELEVYYGVSPAMLEARSRQGRL